MADPATAAEPPRARWRRRLVVSQAVLWATAVLGSLISVSVEARLEAFTLLLSAVAGGILALLMLPDRDRAHGPTIGLVPLVVLAVTPVLWLAWLGLGVALLPALNAALLLVLWRPSRAQLLPKGAGQVALVLALCYLALAPGLDGLFLGPPDPPSPALATTGWSNEGTRTMGLERESGQASLTLVRAQGMPDVELVGLTVDPGVPVKGALAASFSEGGGPPFFFPLLPIVLITNEATTEEVDLTGPWRAVAFGHEETTTFLFLPIFQDTTGERQVFVLRDLGEERQFRFVPPFVRTWDQHAGFRFFQAGDNQQALRELSGNVTVDGVALVPPAAAERELEVVGDYTRSTPGPFLAAVVALLAAAVLRRRGT